MDSSNSPTFRHVTPLHGPGGGAVGTTRLNVAMATFDTWLVFPSSSVARRAKLYEKESNSGMSGTIMTKVSNDPDGLGDVKLPFRILDELTRIVLVKSSRSCLEELPILMSYDVAVDVIKSLLLIIISIGGYYPFKIVLKRRTKIYL